MYFKAQMKFHNAPEMTVFVTARDVTQAKIRAAQKAVDDGRGYPKKTVVTEAE